MQNFGVEIDKYDTTQDTWMLMEVNKAGTYPSLRNSAYACELRLTPSSRTQRRCFEQHNPSPDRNHEKILNSALR
jgi:hypothetical protein